MDRIKNLMCMNHLQMNDTKTEFFTYGTPHLLSKKTLTQSQSEELGNCSKTFKFPGAFLDKTWSFKQHVAKLAPYRIHLIKNVRK